MLIQWIYIIGKYQCHCEVIEIQFNDSQVLISPFFLFLKFDLIQCIWIVFLPFLLFSFSPFYLSLPLSFWCNFHSLLYHEGITQIKEKWSMYRQPRRLRRLVSLFVSARGDYVAVAYGNQITILRKENDYQEPVGNFTCKIYVLFNVLQESCSGTITVCRCIFVEEVVLPLI